jgi:hypothetical protein
MFEKKWYESRTIRLQILFALSIIAQLLIDGNFVQHYIPLEWQTLVFALLNTVLRFKTNKPIV